MDNMKTAPESPLVIYSNQEDLIERHINNPSSEFQLRQAITGCCFSSNLKADRFSGSIV